MIPKKRVGRENWEREKRGGSRCRSRRTGLELVLCLGAPRGLSYREKENCWRLWILSSIVCLLSSPWLTAACSFLLTHSDNPAALHPRFQVNEPLRSRPRVWEPGLGCECNAAKVALSTLSVSLFFSDPAMTAKCSKTVSVPLWFLCQYVCSFGIRLCSKVKNKNKTVSETFSRSCKPNVTFLNHYHARLVLWQVPLGCLITGNIIKPISVSHWN